MTHAVLDLKLKIWRQDSAQTKGRFQTYELQQVSANLSLLEALDALNEQLINQGEEPIAFDHDCREGICGSCGFFVNGQAHGPLAGTSVCQLYLRHFQSGDCLTLEPWRAQAFPLIKDLVVDRSALDRIIQAGGYCSVNTGNAPEANAILISQADAAKAFDAAVCIGCGACIAACKNASASLFTAAKLAHLSLLPQGQPEQTQRVLNLVSQMEAEGFGSCSSLLECQAVCPQEISADWISRMQRQYWQARWQQR